MARNQNTWQSLDKLTLFTIVAIAVFGWMNVYGASYNPDCTGMFNFANFAGKQFVWMLGSIVIAVIILIIDRRAYEYLAYLLYGIALVALIVTPIFSKNVHGSYSFIDIGPLRFQPAEFSKFIIALALAKYMGRDEYSVKSWQDLVIPAIIVAVPMFIIMVPQKETGSALVLVSVIIMFYREGMSGFVILAGIISVALAILVIKFGSLPLPLGSGNFGILISMILLLLIEALFILFHEAQVKETLWMTGGIIIYFGICLLINIWINVNFNIASVIAVVLSTIYLGIIRYRNKLKHAGLLILFSLAMVGFSYVVNIAFDKLPNHQKSRIEELLGIIDDPSGVGYNSAQAKIALATGDITGKGFHKGAQTQMKFVPEQHTDFIFSTVGEEWGFIGTVGLIILYSFLLLRLIKMCERQRNKFSRIYGYCVVSILFFHIAINIGMVIGLLPIIGIPLPFFSYGGSSLFGFTILLFIFLKFDTDRVNEL